MAFFIKKQSQVQILETHSATEKIELLELLKSQEEPKVYLKSIRQDYMSWFVLLQKTRNAKDILVAFAKQITLSNNAINSFNKIPQKYHELITLQY